MPSRLKRKHKETPLDLPRDMWAEMLETISRQHRGSLVQLETHDLETGEKVLSNEMPLETIELDLEDQKNPRINIVVHLDNKLIKHILFLPSRLSILGPDDPREQIFLVETLNTETIVFCRR
jgi:hypothetical protein